MRSQLPDGVQQQATCPQRPIAACARQSTLRTGGCPPCYMCHGSKQSSKTLERPGAGWMLVSEQEFVPSPSAICKLSFTVVPCFFHRHESLMVGRDEGRANGWPFPALQDHSGQGGGGRTGTPWQPAERMNKLTTSSLLKPVTPADLILSA